MNAPLCWWRASFDTTDELMLYEVDDAPDTLGTLVEAWGLELPADTGHTLRYMPPETTDNTVLWVRTDAGWQQADTSVDGSYLTCTAPAGTTAFAAVQHATQLGAEGYAISAVGNDVFGTEIIQELDKNGIDSNYISTVEYPTGSVMVELKNGILPIRSSKVWHGIISRLPKRLST